MGMRPAMSGIIFEKDGTAQGVAKQRLIETIANPDERIINDPYADRFVLGAGLIKFLGHKLNVWLAQKLAPGFHEHVISRTRFIDDLIEKNAASEVEQYVILGAGYDCRAHRLELPSSLRIFEVDQSEVQARKRSKLPEELPNAENVTYVAVDFADQSVSDQLLDAGFDQNKSTVFTLEGVSQYITKEALRSTIKDVARLAQKANSIVFVSYANELLKKDPEACFGRGYPSAEKRARLLIYLSEKVGEPWISFYRAEEMENVLLQNGYSTIESVTVKDLNSQYFTPVGRTIPENQLSQLEHFVIAKSKE